MFDRVQQVLDKRLADVQAERLLWAKKAVSDSVPEDVAVSEQQRLGRELAELRALRGGIVTDQADQADITNLVTDLLRRGPKAYLTVPDEIRRVFNQAWFETIAIDDLEGQVEADSQRAEPFKSVRTALDSANWGMSGSPESDLWVGQKAASQLVRTPDRLVTPSRPKANVSARQQTRTPQAGEPGAPLLATGSNNLSLVGHGSGCWDVRGNKKASELIHMSLGSNLLALAPHT